MTLLFRTAEGDKLLGLAMGCRVAFAIDQHDETSARSVVLRSWVGNWKYHVVEIAPKVVTGRAFVFTHPWVPLRVDGIEDLRGFWTP